MVGLVVKILKYLGVLVPCVVFAQTLSAWFLTCSFVTSLLLNRSTIPFSVGFDRASDSHSVGTLKISMNL